MPYQLRQLTIDDYDEIARVWRDSGLPYRPKGRDSRDYVKFEMSLPDVAYFGQFESDKLVSVAIANFDGRRGWINHLAVDPDYRGQRLAGDIIQACETFLHERGAKVIGALIEHENLPSMATFKREGFLPMPQFIYWSKRNSPDD